MRRRHRYGQCQSLCAGDPPNLAAAPVDCVMHNAEFVRWAGSEMGDQAAIDGAKALAMTAIDFFTNANLRADVAAAFAATGGD